MHALRFGLIVMAALGALLLTDPGIAAAPAKTTAADMRVQDFRTQVEDSRTRLGIPGLSVAVLEDGKLLWTEGFGFADIEAKVPATPDTPYHIASITKTFTALLVWRLVEQGKLALEAPVSRYVPEIKDARIRIEHLLSHTADGTPGDRYSYNPDRFEHLKAILEQAGGKPLRQQFVDTFLDPLQMRDSVPGPDLAQETDQWDGLGKTNLARYRTVMARQAKPYTYYGDGEILRTSYPPADFWASAGLVSSVRDLAKYDAAVDRHALVSEASLARAWTPFVSNAGKPLATGLGWFVTDYRDTRLVWHFGHWGTGFSALYLKIPQEKLTLVMLANSEALADHHYKVGEDVTHDLFACAFINSFVPGVKARRGRPSDAVVEGQPQPGENKDGSPAPATDCASSSRHALAKWHAERRATARKTLPLAPGLAAAVAGRYQVPSRIATFAREGERLFLEWPDGMRAEVFAEGPATAFVKIRAWTMTFVREGDKVTRIDILDNGEVYKAMRVD